MKIVFIGGTRRGYLTLKALLDRGFEVATIISLRQDDHETERFETQMQGLGKQFRVPVLETKWMKDRDYGQVLKQLRPDLGLVVGCRILLPKAVYEAPRQGMIAVHDSLLPEYRGFAPLNWSILNGEDHTGVTLFYLSERMDGGDIVAQKRVAIGRTDTAPQVYERVCQATIDVVLETLPLFAHGTPPRIPQDYEAGSFTCSRAPDDGLIDWARPTLAIFNQVRALTYPYPGAFTFYLGKRLVVWSAELLQPPPTYAGRIPGRVVGVSKEDRFVDVLTGDGVLRLHEVQAEGAGRMAAGAVITSVRHSLGISVTELLERIRSLEQRLGDKRRRSDRSGARKKR